MADLEFDSIAGDTLVCPTCKARQEWSDTCRRCRSDLSLLRQMAGAFCASYHRALEALRDDRIAGALVESEAAYTLCPTPRSARLLAVCRLLAGDAAGAMVAARAACDE